MKETQGFTLIEAFILWGIEAVVSGGSENRTIEAVFCLVDECRE